MARKDRFNHEEFEDELDDDLTDDLDNDPDNAIHSDYLENPSGQWGDPTDPPTEEVSFEELVELHDEIEAEDTTRGDLIDTAHTDGSTENVHLAMDQGLVYDPPHDPPVIPSDDLQGVEIAAGFASSMEDSYLNARDLPDRVDDNDSDLELDIQNALRYNSSPSNLENVRVYVRNGIVYLRGTVQTDDDISIIEELVSDIEGVVDVRDELEVEY